MAGTIETLERMVRRSQLAHVPLHISITSGFFHGINELRGAAILQDVRNAQWYSDGWIADPVQSLPVIKGFADRYRAECAKLGRKPYICLMRDAVIGSPKR